MFPFDPTCPGEWFHKTMLAYDNLPNQKSQTFIRNVMTADIDEAVKLFYPDRLAKWCALKDEHPTLDEMEAFCQTLPKLKLKYTQKVEEDEPFNNLFSLSNKTIENSIINYNGILNAKNVVQNGKRFV